jgi:hypothetical protein
VVATPLAVAVGDTVPHGSVAHDTVQVTPLFDASLTTVAVTFRDFPGLTVCGVEGDKDTVGAVTLTEPGADLVPSATDVAVTVTLRFAAAVLGAVYVVAAPLAVAVGDTEPQGAVEHVTVHVTPLFDESFTTFAMKFTVCPESTLCSVDGETLTEISGGGGGGGLAAPHPKLQTATTSAISVAMIDAKFFDFMTASSRPQPVLNFQNG